MLCPLVKEHSELQALAVFSIPWQCRGSCIVTFPRAARKALGAAALLGNGHGVRAFLWVCHGCSDLNQTPQAIPQLTNKTTNVILQSQARHTCLLPDQHRRDLAGCPFPSRSPAAWHGGRGTSGSRGGHSPLPAPAHGGWELLRAPAQG